MDSPAGPELTNNISGDFFFLVVCFGFVAVEVGLVVGLSDAISLGGGAAGVAILNQVGVQGLNFLVPFRGGARL